MELELQINYFIIVLDQVVISIYKLSVFELPIH
jgi:hypothetical protein